MAIALADLQVQQSSLLEENDKTNTALRILLVGGCPLFRAGLRFFLAQQSDCRLVGEATHLEEVLALTGEEQPDIVLLDGSLASAFEIVEQLRQLGVHGIMVFAPETGDEETLFRFLKYGAMAYVDPYLSGDELLAMMRRVAWGEYLITSDVLVAQAARRARRARIKRKALLDACLEAKRAHDATSSVSESCPAVSEAERAALEQIACGASNAEIALALGISPHTVKNRLDGLYRKLNVDNRTSAVVLALRNRWIALDSR